MAKTLIGDGSDIDQQERGAGLVVILFSRANVEGGLTGDALVRLMSLSDSLSFVGALADKLTFKFEGFDNASREISQIPECISFFRALTKQWPYWFHFLEKNDTSISMVFHLLCDMALVQTKRGMVGNHFVNPEWFAVVAMRLFEGMNSLYETHGISKADNEAMTAKVNAALYRLGS